MTDTFQMVRNFLKSIGNKDGVIVGGKIPVDATFTGTLEVHLSPDNDGVLIFGANGDGHTAITANDDGAIPMAAKNSLGEVVTLQTTDDGLLKVDTEGVEIEDANIGSISPPASTWTPLSATELLVPTKSIILYADNDIEFRKTGETDAVPLKNGESIDIAIADLRQIEVSCGVAGKYVYWVMN